MLIISIYVAINEMCMGFRNNLENYSGKAGMYSDKKTKTTTNSGT